MRSTNMGRMLSCELFGAVLLMMLENIIAIPSVGSTGHYLAMNYSDKSLTNDLHVNDGKTVSSVLLTAATTISTSTIVNTESPDFLSSLKETKRSKPKFFYDPFAPVEADRAEYCRLPAKCQPLNYTTCLGSVLPYNGTTMELVSGLRSQEHAQEQLQVWRGLINLPKCWAVIQPFLCALYFPKCDNGTVDLPSQEMCKMIMGPCRILAIDHGWPSVLRCDNTTKFQKGCENDVRGMKFNTTGRCKPPMVQTDYPSSFYDGMEGCGVQCDNPLFTPDERYQIHRFVAWTATISFLFNLFTVVTFMIDWRSSSKYPALVIFYINFCFMIVCIGWLAQFLPGGRDDIVCRKDGTLRVGEPSAGENLSCVAVFVLVYYFLMAGIVWFVILMYAWDISFQALGKIQERMDKKGAYFHLVAWSLPLVLTIMTMALGEIDGNSVVGICFVGYINHAYRIGLLLVPVFFALCVGGYFLLKGLLTLIRLKISSQEIVSEKASAKIRETIVRMGFFSLLIFVISITSFVCHIYEFRHSSSWKESFRKYVVCQLGLSESECRLENRPSLAILQLHILALFATGVIMSSWVWTSSTIYTWKRFIRRFSSNELEEPVKIKKHKVIAQAFSKRKMLNSNGRLSISIHNTYQDPVGLDFELNSLDSGDLFSSFSSTWAAALPKLVTRRGALTGVTNSNSSQRRNSVDSEFSYSVRRVSVESRRHSLDSAVSVQVEELTGTLHGGGHRTRHKRRHREGRTRTRHRAAPLPASSRHGSTTSQESQLGAQILSALTVIGNVEQPPVPSLVPNLNRRPGNAGLDGSLTVLAGKLFGNLSAPLNYNAPDHTPDSSADEQIEEKQDSSTLPLEEKPLNSSSPEEDEEEDSEGGEHMW